jgi:hypothetical protein
VRVGDGGVLGLLILLYGYEHGREVSLGKTSVLVEDMVLRMGGLLGGMGAAMDVIIDFYDSKGDGWVVVMVVMDGKYSAAGSG